MELIAARNLPISPHFARRPGASKRANKYPSLDGAAHGGGISEGTRRYANTDGTRAACQTGFFPTWRMLQTFGVATLVRAPLVGNLVGPECVIAPRPVRFKDPHIQTNMPTVGIEPAASTPTSKTVMHLKKRYRGNGRCANSWLPRPGDY